MMVMVDEEINQNSFSEETLGWPCYSYGTCASFCSGVGGMAPLTVCIVTVSDRCSRGEAEDTSGNNLERDIHTLLCY